MDPLPVMFIQLLLSGMFEEVMMLGTVSVYFKAFTATIYLTRRKKFEEPLLGNEENY